MERRRRLLKALIASPMLSQVCAGCATNFYGYSHSEWQSLNEAQREAAIRDYDAMLAAEREYEYKRRFIEPIKETIIDRGLSEQGRYTR